MKTTYDDLIKKYAIKYNLPWRLIKAQIQQESDFDPRAESSCGARGLMQLMPATAAEMVKDADLWNPEINVDLGVRYDRIQFDRFPEIPLAEDRLKFMLAAFNGGRGYSNAALRIAYSCEHGEEMPRGHKGVKPGQWQTWEFTATFFCSPYCLVGGKKPDYRQILDYVEKIWDNYLTLDGI